MVAHKIKPGEIHFQPVRGETVDNVGRYVEEREIGLDAHQLTTKELIEMYFEFYNPNISASYSTESSIIESQPSIATQYKEKPDEPEQQFHN